MEQNRREFLKNCGKVSASLICGSSMLILPGCGGIRYLAFDTEDNALVVKKSDFIEKPFAAIKSRNLPAPVYIHKIDEENYSAVLMECTHKKCELSAAGDLLICPCHGSEFSNTGEVLSPPAEQPLQKFTVRTDAENVYIEMT